MLPTKVNSNYTFFPSRTEHICKLLRCASDLDLLEFSDILLNLIFNPVLWFRVALEDEDVRVVIKHCVIKALR